MAGTPQHVPGENRDAMVQRIAALERALAAAVNRVPFPFAVTYDPSGDGTPPFVNMFSVVNSGWFDPDGNPIPTTAIRDAQGNIIFGQAPAAFSGNVATAWYWAFTDVAGNQLIASDGLAGKGLAYPFENVAMYPQWNGLSTTPSNNGYATAIASALTTAKVMWEGRLGFVSHPAISVDGIWGNAGGSTSGATYRLVINGVTMGTWITAPGVFDGVDRHTFDISSIVGAADLTVQITAQSSVTSSDQMACQVMGVHMRQTPLNSAFG